MGFLHHLLLFILIARSTQLLFMAEGRLVRKPLEASKVGEGDDKAFMRAMIGSRPPSCDRRCSSCGHCEAVQVPAVPQDKKNKIGHSSASSKSSITTSSRGDDTTNYKPMSWKCKCGDLILNP
ncbi:EPIDERMAL PATTERNING FACTOR-like protein 2 [Acorus calamus]|uniref:Epidermal patterning factor-like protein n=1 Tax=Acorus calamus TaxID=4465 RepID=A0AAV9FDK0_ACOCL|nr:EPIDERMAL PATTERNING FACTOR-like protein 2 [Acorus calamus]